jgi:hypothetical protein
MNKYKQLFMKKFIALFITITFLTGCSNDFDLTENWQDITVAYGLLDQSQPVQYIRVEKAFLDPSTSALTIAQISDSLYYDNITVELRAFRPNGSGGNVYTLQRVNAEDEGFSREDGIFATSPNYIYKLNEQIDEDFTYRLVITKADGSTVEAETKICEDFDITSPYDVSVPMRFDSERNQPTTFRWSSTSNSKFYNAKILVEIRETPVDNPNVTTNRKLVWNITDNIKPNANGLVSLAIPGTSFYDFMGESLESGYNRELIGIELLVGAGAEDLMKYIEIGTVNSGITGADLTPTYTNLEGENVYGVFSSRYYKTFGQYQNFTEDTLDSLSMGYKTNNLGF